MPEYLIFSWIPALSKKSKISRFLNFFLCPGWNRTFLERKVPKELLQWSSHRDDHGLSPPCSLGCDFPGGRAKYGADHPSAPAENPAQPIRQTRSEHPAGMRSEVFFGSFCSQPTLPARAMQTWFANCRAARRKTSGAKLKRTVPSSTMNQVSEIIGFLCLPQRYPAASISAMSNRRTRAVKRQPFFLSRARDILVMVVGSLAEPPPHLAARMVVGE